MLEVTGQATQTHYHSISGEILPHFYVKNIFLAQILSELEHILCLTKSMKTLQRKSHSWAENP